MNKIELIKALDSSNHFTYCDYYFQACGVDKYDVHVNVICEDTVEFVDKRIMKHILLNSDGDKPHIIETYDCKPKTEYLTGWDKKAESVEEKPEIKARRHVNVKYLWANGTVGYQHDVSVSDRCRQFSMNGDPTISKAEFNKRWEAIGRALSNDEPVTEKTTYFTPIDQPDGIVNCIEIVGDGGGD